jgi:xanthine dehydrogenase accessory factor
MLTWPTILRFLERDGVAVLVTVAEAKGSTPREQGARMVVRADGAFKGTIGGGTLEWLALAEAQKVLDGGPPVATLDKALGPDLGQCCGGRAVLSIERFAAEDGGWIQPLAAAESAGPIETAAKRDRRGVWVRRLVFEAADAERAKPRTPAQVARILESRLKEPRNWPNQRSVAAETPRVPLERAVSLQVGSEGYELLERFGEASTPVLLFGAGHVGRALVLALAPLPFRITWVDPRPDAFPAHVPANATCVAEADPANVLDAAPPGALVCVMSHSHALDLAVVSAALPDPRFPFVGLIGSRTKRARFTRQIVDAGHAPEVAGRLVCPIGLPGLSSKEPAVIAAGVVAQLLLEREGAGRAASRGGLMVPMTQRRQIGSVS